MRTSSATKRDSANVDGVYFMMKEIAAVKAGTIGHSSQTDNPVRTITLPAYRIGVADALSVHQLEIDLIGKSKPCIFCYGS